MSEALVPSSPNWFLSSCVCVAPDGYVLYGTLSVGIGVLVPKSPVNKGVFEDFRVVRPAHKERVTCLSLCPDWLSSRLFASGADDGFVKLWNAETLTSKIGHNVHSSNKEVITGVGFLDSKRVVSVGNLGFVAVWDIRLNAIQNNEKVLKGYKTTCMSCCTHRNDVVAVGTKQGVVIVLNVTDKISILYKAPGHEAEITALSWCPSVSCEYLDSKNEVCALTEVTKTGAKTRKSLKSSEMKHHNKKQENDNNEDAKLETALEQNIEEKDEKIPTHNDKLSKEMGTISDFLGECGELLKLIEARAKNPIHKFRNDYANDDSDDQDLGIDEIQNSKNRASLSCNQKFTDNLHVDESICKHENSDEESFSCGEKSLMNRTDNSYINESKQESLDEDSDNNRERKNIMDESDIFDIYKDHSIDEFGHTKNFGTEIRHSSIKKEESPSIRKYLHAKRKTKNVDDTKIVKEIEKISLEDKEKIKINGTDSFKDDSEKNSVQFVEEENQLHRNDQENVNRPELDKVEESNVDNLSNNLSSMNINEGNNLYLASCCKNGRLCIWRWGGSLVLCKELKTPTKNKKKDSHYHGAILWIKSDEIIATTKDSSLVSCKLADKISLSELHSTHKRGLFNISSNFQNTENSDDLIWTASMDRLFAGYSLENKITYAYTTFGGYIYDLQFSPIDPDMFAIGCADGTVRVWKMTSGEDDISPISTCSRQFWNGIHGKVLSLAWHPTKENVLAFSTYEGRVGLLNVSTETPAKILPLTSPMGVFHICWDSSDHLFACGNGALVIYNTSKEKIEFEKISVKVFNENCSVSTMCWNDKFLTIGSGRGALVLLGSNHPYEFKAVEYPFRKSITCVTWHPTAVTTEDEVSLYEDLIATSAKASNIVVMKVVKEEEQIKLEVFRDYTIHADHVTNLCWSPHHNGVLISSSHDHTIQVYDILNENLIHTFTDHREPVLCAAWCPTHLDYILSVGEDCALRIWNVNKYPPLENLKAKKKNKSKMILAKSEEFTKTDAFQMAECKNTYDQNSSTTDTFHTADFETANIIKPTKLKKADLFMSLFWKQFKKSDVEGCYRLFGKLKTDSSETLNMDYSNGYDYLRIYGTHEDVIDLLNMEQNVFKETSNWYSWAIIGILKGDIKSVLEFLVEKQLLTPMFLSLAPSVSHRFWKEMLTEYCIQLKKENIKNIHDVGTTYTKEAWRGLILLSTGQVEEGCFALYEDGLRAEAICAAKARHADHIAKKLLEMWIENQKHGPFTKAAECYLALNLPLEAATVLAKSNEELDLAAAAEMAKYSGNAVLADSYLK